MDSGGPLMVSKNRRQLVMSGTVSWGDGGDGCARENLPGVYAEVASK